MIQTWGSKDATRVTVCCSEFFGSNPPPHRAHEWFISKTVVRVCPGHTWWQILKFYITHPSYLRPRRS